MSPVTESSGLSSESSRNFFSQTSWANLIKLFTSVIYNACTWQSDQKIEKNRPIIGNVAKTVAKM
jgi:hypothetical protein